MTIYNYAYALYEKASEEDCVNIINEEFHTLISIIENNEKLINKWFDILRRPDISLNQKYLLIDELDGFSDLFLNFLKIVVKDNVSMYLDNIYSYFLNLIKKENELILVTATFGRKPSKKAQNEVMENLKIYFDTDNIDLTILIDKNILGGYKITYDGNTLDSSYKMQLERLKDSI